MLSISQLDPDLLKFHQDASILDIHLHGRDLYPEFIQQLSRYFPFKKLFPPLAPISNLKTGNVNGGVLCAVGDRPLDRPRDTHRFLKGIASQIQKLKEDVHQSKGCIVRDVQSFQQALKQDQLVFMLGLEGLSPSFDSVLHLEALHKMGIRIITPVHMVNNRIGTTTAEYLQYWRQHPKTHVQRGLTQFGEAVIRKMDALGLLIDLAHADEETFGDIAGLSRRPLVVSHSGAYGIQPFHRYLKDQQISQIRQSGGIIGLWPMYFLGSGIKNSDDFKAHVKYLLARAGEDHIAIGTDLHGVPGYINGYHGPENALLITKLLFETGLNETQVRKILGLNFLRVFNVTVT